MHMHKGVIIVLGLIIVVAVGYIAVNPNIIGLPTQIRIMDGTWEDITFHGHEYRILVEKSEPVTFANFSSSNSSSWILYIFLTEGWDFPRIGDGTYPNIKEGDIIFYKGVNIKVNNIDDYSVTLLVSWGE